jgi:hypothetical protein
MTRAIEINLGSKVSIVGDDGPPCWIGKSYVTGTLSKHLVVEQYLAPWTRQGTERMWDLVALIELDEQLEVPADLVPEGLPLERSSTGHRLVNKLLLVQRYPELPWADGCTCQRRGTGYG